MDREKQLISQSGQCWIGTSGWSYPDWKGTFYPPHWPTGRYLEYYARHFSSIELNNTFYHLPKVDAVQHWTEIVPNDFLFSIKASRFITHIQKLSGNASSVHRFFEHIEPLTPHMGPILFQLPGRWHMDLERLQEFIELLPEGHRYAFEFRDQTWLNPDVYAVLAKANIALCLYDFGGTALDPKLTADFTYLRFHGPQKNPYTGQYSKRFLQKWARQIQRWQASGVDVYCYFDNTANAAAIHNAETLQSLIA